MGGSSHEQGLLLLVFRDGFQQDAGEEPGKDTQQNGSGNVDQQKTDALLLHLQFQPLQRRKHHHLQHRTARTELDHTAEIPCFR